MRRPISILVTLALVLFLGGNLVYSAYATDSKMKLITGRVLTHPVYLIFDLFRFKEKTVTPTTADIIIPSETVPAEETEAEWMLILVNDKHPLSDTYEPELETLANGMQFEARAIDQLNLMLADAKAEGLSPIVCSAYRSVEYQRKLFENQIKKLTAQGLERKQAEAKARNVVAYPGTSEHSLGLAADIVSFDYQLLDEEQANTPELKWLTTHCSRYGFILRYPEGKTHLTGIIYEPWHFRYVGREAAKAIMESGQCLEEYLENRQAF